MAYADPFDPTTPAGSEEKANGDDRIRELKRGLIQRLDTLTNFSTTADPVTDPLRLKPGVVRSADLEAGIINSLDLFTSAILADFARIDSITMSPGTGAIAGGALATLTIPFVGVTGGDAFILTLPTVVTDAAKKLIINIRVSATADSIDVTFFNPTAGVLNPVAGGDGNWTITRVRQTSSLIVLP